MLRETLYFLHICGTGGIIHFRQKTGAVCIERAGLGGKPAQISKISAKRAGLGAKPARHKQEQMFRTGKGQILYRSAAGHWNMKKLCPGKAKFFR